MSFSAISGIAELDASGYVSESRSVVDAQEGIATSADGASESLFDVDPAGIAAAGALVGVGTAAQRVLDDTQELRESLGRTAVDMDISADEANALARSLSDATFPIDDVTGTMNALSQQGVETEAEMVRLAEASDLLADATGTSAESVANELGPAVRGLDGDLDGLEENADAFTLAVRSTALETSDLAQTMERSSDELREMNIQSDEAAALIAAYGEETGKSGRQLRRDFASELRDADGDMGAFMQSTGLSQEQLDEFNREVSEGGDITEEYADAANDSLTTMDHLRAGFDDARLALGGYLGPVSAGVPLLQGLGGAGMFVSTVNTGAVIPSIVGITTVSAPLLAALAGVGLVLGGLALVWNQGWIDPVETATWAAGRIQDGIWWVIDALNQFYPPIVLARELWDRNFLGIQDTTESVFGTIGDLISWLIDRINAIPGVSIGEDDVDVDDSAIEDAADDTSATYTSETEETVDHHAADSTLFAAAEDADEQDVREPAAIEEPDRPTGTASSLSTDDLRRAFLRALEDARYTLELDTNRTVLEDLIDERARLVVQEELT